MYYILITLVFLLLSAIIIVSLGKSTWRKYGSCHWCHRMVHIVAVIIEVLAIFAKRPLWSIGVSFRALYAGVLDANEMSENEKTPS